MARAALSLGEVELGEVAFTLLPHLDCYSCCFSKHTYFSLLDSSSFTATIAVLLQEE